MARREKLPPASTVPMHDATGKGKPRVREALYAWIEAHPGHDVELVEVCAATGFSPLQIRQTISSMHWYQSRGNVMPYILTPKIRGHSWSVKRAKASPGAFEKVTTNITDQEKETIDAMIDVTPYQKSEPMVFDHTMRVVGKLRDDTFLVEDYDGQLYRLVRVG